jgi:steroid delta-isomerase-like uncharacterized protein
MSAEQNKAIIRRWIEEAWNQGNVELADEFYAADFSAIDADNPERILHGPADIKQYAIRLRAAFPDIHFTIDHLFAEGDKVVGAFTIRGTHQGTYLGCDGDIAPTGKKVVFKAVDIWRFANGKIVERCIASIDRLGLLQQLGAVLSMEQE